MKIAIFNSLPPDAGFGGAELSCGFLASALAQNGHDVLFVTICKSWRKSILRSSGAYRILELAHFSYYWPFDRSKRGAFKKYMWHALERINIMRALQVINIVRKNDIDIIITSNLLGFGVFVWLVAALRRIPIIHITRDYGLVCKNGKRVARGRLCAGQCISCTAFTLDRRLASMVVDYSVGISRHMEQVHRASGYLSCSAWRVIYNHVGLIRNAEERGEVSRIQKVTWGYLGRIDTEKGVERLLEIFSGALRGEVLKIAGVGESDYVASLRSVYRSHNIEFVGSVIQQDFLRGIDVLLVPSLWSEPFGRVVLEAAACGVYPVVQNRGGLPEAVDVCGFGAVVDFYAPGVERKLLKVIRSPLSARRCFDVAFHDFKTTESYISLSLEACRRENVTVL